MNAQEQLKTFKSELDVELKKYLDVKVAEAAKISPLAKELVEHIADLTLRGGKRIRAALLYNSYLAHGGDDRKAALHASMSMELAETYLLIHDDIMDDDSLRRGGTTIHESYRKIAKERFENKVDPKTLGDSIGILAGDIAAAMSNSIIAESDLSSKNKAHTLLLLNNTYITECYGQALDIFATVRDDLTPEDVIQVHQLKTVPYTFDAPIKIGAALAGAEDKAIAALEGYSVPLGTAFQVQDDILGMFGSEEKLGKPVTSDLQEGKQTLLILKALEKADSAQKEIIKSNLGNKNATISDLEAVRLVIQETGSLDESKKLAATLVKEATDAIESLDLQPEGKQFLVDIADYMVKREY